MSQVKLSGKSLVIQIDSEHIRIAQTVLGAASPQLNAETVVNTPAASVDDGVLLNPEAVKAAIREALERAGLSRVRQAVFTLCTSQVITEVVHTPRVSGSRLDALLQANLDVYFPADVKDYLISYEKLDEVGSDRGAQEQTLRLWATPRTLVLPYYNVANALGISVAAIEWFGHSLVNSVGASFAPADPKKKRKARAHAGGEAESASPLDESAEQADTTASTLYIDAEPEFLLMTFVKNDQVMMQRLLRRDSSEFSEAQIVLDYYRSTDAGRYSTIRGVLIGSLPQLGSYAGQLQRELEIPIQIDGGGQQPEWYLCAGAAMATVDFGSSAFNRVTRASDQVHQLWQYALILVGGLAVAAAVLGIVINRTTWNSKISAEQSRQDMIMMQMQVETNRYADVKEQQAAYEEAYQGYLGEYIYYSRSYDNLYGPNGDKAALENAVRTYNGNLVLMLKELEQVLPAGTSVLTIGIGDEGMGLEFSCTSKEEAAQLIQELRGLEYATLENVSGLSLQRSGGTTGYAMLPSLQAMLEAEKAAEAARQQAMIEAQMAAAAGEGELSENLSEEPPTEGSSVGDFSLEKRAAAIRWLIESDAEGWDFFLQALIDQAEALSSDPNADQNSAFFSQIRDKMMSMLNAGDSQLTGSETLELMQLGLSMEDIRTAVSNGDKAGLDDLLSPHRSLIARLMTVDDEMLGYSESFIEGDLWLQAKYKNYLTDENVVETTPEPTVEPTVQPTAEPTVQPTTTPDVISIEDPDPVSTQEPTPTAKDELDENELQELLKKYGLLDDSGKPIGGSGGTGTGSTSGSSGGTGTGTLSPGHRVDGTQEGELIYFGAILRYKEELIQQELETKEMAIEPQEKLPPLEQFTAGGENG